MLTAPTQPDRIARSPISSIDRFILDVLKITSGVEFANLARTGNNISIGGNTIGTTFQKDEESELSRGQYPPDKFLGLSI